MTTTDRRCPMGHPVDATSAFCSECGARIDAGADAPSACANGHQLGQGDVYCTQCGAPSTIASPSGASSYVPLPPLGFAGAGVGWQGPAPYQQQYAPQFSPPYQYMQPQSTNGLAIASLVVSLVFFCGVNAILALVFGIVALRQIKNTNQPGRGLAIAGVVISSVQLVLGLFWLVFILAISHSGSSSASSLLASGQWPTA